LKHSANVITKASQQDNQKSVEFITDDTLFWSEFRKVLANGNVVTCMGTQEYLAKFLTERNDEIKEAYGIYNAENLSSEKETSIGVGVQRRRYIAFSTSQSMKAKGNTTMTSSRAELSFFKIVMIFNKMILGRTNLGLNPILTLSNLKLPWAKE